MKTIKEYRSVLAFPYLGGKTRLVKKISAYFPEHAIYVEPFGGSAAMLLYKDPSPTEVYNDAADVLVTFFQVLQDKLSREELMKRLKYTPYARREYGAACAMLDHHENAGNHRPADLAWAFFIAQCQGFSGGGGFGKRSENYWAFSVDPNGRTDQSKRFLGFVQKLEAIAERFKRVHIEHRDALKVIKTWDRPETLFYLDPPYVDATRSGKRNGRSSYLVETDDNFHEDLVERLLTLQGKAILSGYNNGLYTPLEDAGWQKVSFSVPTYSMVHSTKKGQGKAEEVIWVSPGCSLDALRLVG
jgi:DNA adenine methylase